MPTEDLMAKFGVKTGGLPPGDGTDDEEQTGAQSTNGKLGGRRKRHSKSHKGNSWLDHVKYTMKEKKNKGKSFKQILKLAKKSYKKSQSQSGGKGRKGTRKGQHGGSGGKVAGVGESAYPYV
jgi:hypothetical protein